MGVCCIVFDIDGMLFEFFMNFLNILKKIKFNFFFQYFKFSSRFILFPTLKKIKNWCKKKNPGGGRCGFFFLEKQFFLISLVMLFSTLNKYIEKCPFTYWLNGSWSLQIVERDWVGIYIHYILYSLVLILYLKCGGGLGGGGCNVFLTFYAISNISRKNNLGIQNNYFSFNVLYAGNIVKCPFTYSYWLNGRWFLQIVDIGNFIMRLEILKSSPSLTS